MVNNQFVILVVYIRSAPPLQIVFYICLTLFILVQYVILIVYPQYLWKNIVMFWFML